MDEITGPAWLEPTTLEDWPTQTITREDLHYRLPIPVGWSSEPIVDGHAAEEVHIYRGPMPAEWLVVSFMPADDPASYLGNWVEAIIHITGFPVPAMRQAFDPPPELLTWQQEWGGEALAQRVGADEIFFYQGMAELPGQPPDMAHMYVVLLRRGEQAWKICLSFSSACPPGTSEEIVESNDHVRAGATFGYLELL